MQLHVSMALCKAAVTQLLTHWCYCSRPLSHWASYQIRKSAGCACTGNAGSVFPVTNFKGNRDLAIPACFTARASRMSRSLTRNGENVLGNLGACATRNFTYLVRGPCPKLDVGSKFHHQILSNYGSEQAAYLDFNVCNYHQNYSGIVWMVFSLAMKPWCFKAYCLSKRSCVLCYIGLRIYIALWLLITILGMRAVCTKISWTVTECQLQ